MKAATETSIVRACLDLLAIRGVFAWRNNSTGVYDPVRKCFRSFQGMKGTSDILGVLPGGRLLAVECKRPRCKMTLEQAAFIDAINGLGGLAVCVHDAGELDMALRIERVMSAP